MLMDIWRQYARAYNSNQDKINDPKITIQRSIGFIETQCRNTQHGGNPYPHAPKQRQ
jgi:hypothetical protein